MFLTVLIHPQVRVNGVSDTKTVMNPVWISWCSLLPARMVWLDASVQYLPLERNPAWRGRLLVGSGKGVKSLGNFSICTSGSKGPMSINPEGDFTLVMLFILAVHIALQHTNDNHVFIQSCSRINPPPQMLFCIRSGSCLGQ